jgi:hypothetical protein
LTRLTQISLLHLLTTPAAMDGKPLTMGNAWRVHDRLSEDDRVALLPEPAAFETLRLSKATGWRRARGRYRSLRKKAQNAARMVSTNWAMHSRLYHGAEPDTALMELYSSH